jgi:hypothetical protein
MISTQYTAAGVIDAVRLELENSTTDVCSAFDEGFAKGAEWALANVEDRMKRADDLFRVMCDELTVVKELRAKLAAMKDRNAVLRKDGEDLCTLLAKIRDKLAAAEAQKDDQLRLVAEVRAEVCELLSCHIDTPNLGRDALRRLRDFIDQRRAALAQEQANV